MQKVLTAKQMREVDRLTTERFGIPSILLMENAAHAAERVITEKLGGSVMGKSIVFLCGKDSNGGDGAALARILWTQGANCYVYLFAHVAETRGDVNVNFEILKRISDSPDTNGPDENCLVLSEHAEFPIFQSKDEVVVDALFGTGLRGPIMGDLENVIVRLQRDFVKKGRLYVSLDIPSGIQSNNGEAIGAHVHAHVTVSFTSPKPGNILAPASRSNGELIIANIGSPPDLIDEQPSKLFLATSSDARSWLRETRFSDGSYKNKRGHSLVIAGSNSYSGAAVLAGNAAMRSGVGLVTVVTPVSSRDSVASRVLPEVMVKGVSETAGRAISDEAFVEIGNLLDMADSVAIGCGLSQDESTRTFVKKVVENRHQPTIVDADALNLLSPFAVKPVNGASKRALVLTPHEGEFMRLLGSSDKDAIKDRVTAVREFSQKHKVILVLKGERILIGEPGGKVVVNPTGNAGLGKAGNGDTLTGILAGFIAQAVRMNVDIFETVVTAVYAAGMAGDIAVQKYGERVMTASDVRECLSEVFDTLD